MYLLCISIQFFLSALYLVTAQENAMNPCDRTGQIIFISGLENGQECNTNFGPAQIMPSTPAGMTALDDICTTDCAGAVADWLQGPQCNTSNMNFNLENVFDGRFLELWCQPVEDADISRCRFALDLIDPTLVNNSDIFSCLEFTGNECPGNCAAGLNLLANGIGCCYQSIYNTTDILRALVAIMGITNEQNDLFIFLQNPMLWNACDVEIIDQCTADPFASPRTSTTSDLLITSDLLLTQSTFSGASSSLTSTILTIAIGVVLSILHVTETNS